MPVGYAIIEAKYLEDYKILLKFNDNSIGIVDFKEYTQKPGLFKKLTDLSFFKDFYIDKEVDTICWSNGLDISPDTLYMKATGKGIPGLEHSS